MSKASLGVVIGALFAIVTTVTPIPDEWKPLVMWIAWSLLGFFCVVWLLGRWSEFGGLTSGSIPGFSFHITVRIHNLPGNRRKYLFDFGQMHAERLSLYISPDNIFTFCFVDAKGEPHLVQLPLGRGGPVLGKFIYISFELGISGESTEMRLFVRSKEIGSIKLPFKTDIGGLSLPNGVIGADLKGENGSRIDLLEVLIIPRTITGWERIKIRWSMWRYTWVWPRCVEFNGAQWQRVSATGNRDLKQPEPSKQPTMRSRKA
jgi:hypothetical protein